MASGTPAPSTHDAEVFCRTEQEDKAAMTSAPATPVDRGVSPKSVGSPSLLRRSIRALLPSRSRSAAALSDRSPSPKSAPIAEKRRRFSATRGLPGFDSGDLQRSLLMAAVG
ncbi:hypothetical protein M3Y99_00456000 [Aphelenchoides fujianensis]|nr:hypothetical protein M3Y99_00456000 [Aphelenchoides fujianensis]